MGFWPGVLAQAGHKAGTWWVVPATASAPATIVPVPSYCSLSEASKWKHSSPKPPFRSMWEWKAELVGAFVHFQ